MKAKEKETWHPLSGDIGPIRGLYHGTIERVRKFWGAKTTTTMDANGDVTYCIHIPSGTATKKANRIYKAWMKYRDELYHHLTSLYDAEEEMRLVYLDDLVFHFRWKADMHEISVFEILTIIAIAEAKENIETGENDELPIALLRNAEDYNPDTLRGIKTVNGARVSGNARKRQVEEAHGEIWKDWQTRADDIWKKNPSLSKSETAKRIHNALKEEKQPSVMSVHTIRQRIKK